MCVCVLLADGVSFFFASLCVRNSSEGSDPGILCSNVGTMYGGKEEERVCGGGCSLVLFIGMENEPTSLQKLYCSPGILSRGGTCH